MQFETVALPDAASGKWYGVLIVRIGSNPARILDQTDPVYDSKDECLAEMKRMLSEAVKATLGG